MLLNFRPYGRKITLTFLFWHAIKNITNYDIPFLQLCPEII